MQKPESRRTYTIAEAAELLGVGKSAAYEAAKRGEIPVIRIGRRMVVPKEALQRLLNDPAAATA